MDLREQIARALAEVEHGEGAWEHLADGWHTRYLALAQAVLPFIAAERERCVETCANHMADCLDDRDIQRNWPQIKARNDVYAAAIRSQQP